MMASSAKKSTRIAEYAVYLPILHLDYYGALYTTYIDHFAIVIIVLFMEIISIPL